MNTKKYQKHTRSFFLFVLAILFLPTPHTFAQTFSDVSPSHHQYAAVESLKNLGVINGFSDGTFGPQKPVTRAEATKMIFIAAGKHAPQTTETGFHDVLANAWYAPYIVAAKAAGIVKGYGDTGMFRPNKQVTKAEFIKMTLTGFEKDSRKHIGAKNIAPDVTATDWFVPYMSYAKTIGLLTPEQEGNLMPNAPMTRGECAEVLYRILVIEEGGEVQKYLNIVEAKLVSILVDLNNNNIESALQNANAAVISAQIALTQAPDESIVKAVHHIALGFQQLCFGYKAGMEKNTTDVMKYAAAAKKHAGLAFGEDVSTQPIGKQIKAQADVLLGQLEGNTE